MRPYFRSSSASFVPNCIHSTTFRVYRLSVFLPICSVQFHFSVHIFSTSLTSVFLLTSVLVLQPWTLMFGIYLSICLYVTWNLLIFLLSARVTCLMYISRMSNWCDHKVFWTSLIENGKLLLFLQLIPSSSSEYLLLILPVISAEEFSYSVMFSKFLHVIWPSRLRSSFASFVL